MLQCGYQSKKLLHPFSITVSVNKFTSCDSQAAAKISIFDLIDIDTVCNIVKTVDKVRDRSFACTGGTHKGNFLTRIGIEGNVI